MVELRVLGSLELDGREGEDTRSILSQPKRATLLVYLAVARPRGFHTREKLLGLFWPEQDQEHARSALRSSLYFLRGSLNDELLRSRGPEDIGLDHERIWCDAIAFEEAIDAEDLEEALVLYRGDLLDGVFLSDCPELERWLDGERERLREMAAGAAWTLAHRHIEEGRLVEAERTGQRALALVGSDESAVREFIAALAAVGDRAGAVRFYEKFAEGLRRDLELEPSTHSQELASQIRASTGSALPARVAMSQLTLRTTTRLGYPRTREMTAPEPTAALVPWQARPKVSWGFAAVFAALAAVTLWALSHQPPQPVTEVKVNFVTPDGESAISTPAVSPDGSLTVAAVTGGDRTLWVWPARGGKPEPIQGTSGVRHFTFSPAGSSIAYVQSTSTGRGEIWRVSVRGGFPTRVIPSGTVSEDPEAETVEEGEYPAWGDDKMIYFLNRASRKIYRVPADGENPQPFTTVTGPNECHTEPDVLPDGQGLVFTVLIRRDRGPQARWIATVGPKGGEPELLFPGIQPRYAAASGHLFYATVDGELMAVPFDPGRRKPTGPSRSVRARLFLQLDQYGSRYAYSLSGDGTLLYKKGPPDQIPQSRLVLATPEGEEQVDSTWIKPFESPRLSPDSRRFAVVSPEEDRKDIWVGGFGGERRALTRGWGEVTATTNVGPTWTPNSKYVTFLSDRYRQLDVWMRQADGMESAKLVLDRERGITEVLWAPNGSWLVYATDRSEEGAGDILAIQADSGYSIPPHAEPIPLAETEAHEWKPALSPDGQWLAYLSNETGFDRISVVPFPNPGEERWTLNRNQVTHFAWHPTDPVIFFTVKSTGNFAVTVETKPTFSFGDIYPEDDWKPDSDMAWDGQSSLRLDRVLRPPRQPDPGWRCVRNLFEELKGEGGP